MKHRWIAWLMLAGLLISACARAQTEEAAAREHRLLIRAKTLYVEPMPDGLDQWIIQDLRAWGKYQISGSSEGVDLLIRAKKPGAEHLLHPQGAIPRVRLPKKSLPVLSVTLVNWVTGERLWQADILDSGPKKNQPPPPPGPRTEIYARHMKPDEIAERCTNALQRYVESIEQAHPPAKP
ncbi:MAG: hypothetical protein KGM47_05385 [Acidobacteriota bacterium]|nr:hypothetical protein [Acidobacteriota bacterium]